MDEAGSRVHIANIHVPQVIEELERSVEEIKNKKKEAVKQQNFEVAAAFRDKERQLLAQLEQEKDNWQKELKENRVVVDEESVAEVVAMMTGVPVKRIAKTEGMKLLQMREELADSVVGQQEAIEKIVKGDTPEPGRIERPQPTDRIVHFPGAYRCRKNSIGQSIGTISVRYA